MATLKERVKSARLEIAEELQLANFFESPNLQKLTINVGLGSLHSDSKLLAQVERDLRLITGQRPVKTKAKKSIAGFKLREGMVVGMMVTLRGERMYYFIQRLIDITLPRIRDFKGLSPKSFDKSANYTFGIKEHSVFPEAVLQEGDVLFPIQITFSFSASTVTGSTLLLKKLKFPLK